MPDHTSSVSEVDESGERQGAYPPLSVISISKSFGATKALTDVSLVIEEGETRGLIGRNGAGKSTLAGILSGVIKPDSGEIYFWGKPSPSPEDRGAWRRLVAMVYQHSSLIPPLTVAENLFLGLMPTKYAGLVSWAEVNKKARQMLDDWELNIPETVTVDALSLAERQLVEIARELALGAKFVILDEPTSRLTYSEINNLYHHVRRFQELGVSFLYISHHLEEIFDLTDRVSVLRDGKLVATKKPKETTLSDLISDMVGDTRSDKQWERSDEKKKASTKPVLQIINLEGNGLGPLSFTIMEGEVLGVAGLIGSGKEILTDFVSGLATPSGGQIQINGRRVDPGSVSSAMDAGIGYVPPDRHRSGLVAPMSVAENLTMAISQRIANKIGFIAPEVRRTYALETIQEVGVVASSPDLPATSLSGGNQQKVVVGRALATEPHVLVLANPTTGVDVASKQQIYELIEKFRDRGTAILFYSDELEEYSLCDRILVLFKGQVSKTYDKFLGLADLLAAVEGGQKND